MQGCLASMALLTMQGATCVLSEGVRLDSKKLSEKNVFASVAGTAACYRPDPPDTPNLWSSGREASSSPWPACP